MKEFSDRNRAGPATRLKTKRRRWLFILLATTAVPAILLVILDLSIAGLGLVRPVNYFVRGTDGDYFSNMEYGLLYFPKALARTPEFCRLTREKPTDVYRVFVMGGSAARSFPEPSFSFARIFERMLEVAYPQRRFQVHNTAMTAINSHVVRDIAADCAAFQPNLFVVFVGNNEVVGPYGPGTVLGSYTPSLTAIRSSLWVKSTAIGRLWQSVVPEPASNQQWRGMQMFLENQIHVEDPRLEKVIKNYEANLTAICRTARRSGAGVLLCTVPTNLKDCPPFASSHPESWNASRQSRWRSLYLTGTQAVRKGDFEAALSSFAGAEELDSDYAELQFYIGQCYLALNRNDEARAAFVRARDCDALRFRADSRLNESVRRVADSLADKGVVLVDADRACERDTSSLAGIVGNELFHEHVHLNFAGNYVVARELLAALRLEGDRAPPPLGYETCVASLAYTAWNRHAVETEVFQLMDEPPFTNQLNHSANRARRHTVWKNFEENILDQAKQDALVNYQTAVTAHPDDWMLHRNFARLLHALHDFREAADQVLYVYRRFPQEATFRDWLRQIVEGLVEQAAASVRRGDEIDALARFRQAAEVAREAGLADMILVLSEQLEKYQSSGELRELDLFQVKSVPMASEKK